MSLRLALILVSLLFTPLSRAELKGRRPNVILIITDDQGYGDISAHGNPVLKTPNLDRLHAESVRFTDFHVSPTCAPTRSALLTGRHEFRNGVTHTILERERLTLDATTLPQVLKRAGYTTGIFGKWHLGDEPAYWPSARGYDEMFIHGAGGIGQTYPGSCGDAPGNTYFDPAILHNGKFVRTQGYCTDVFFREAMRWIEEVKGKEQPFFCHLATNAPHAPLDVPPEDAAIYAGKVSPDAAKFFGMIANIDRNVGALLDLLAARKLDRDTLVIFMTDNGGTVGVPIFNGGVRGRKVTAWLGGTRACSFWRWPGTLQPGHREQLTAHIDFFPTISELAGAALQEKEFKQVEGRSLVPLLKESGANWPERTLFTHVGRWPAGSPPETGKYAHCAVRKDRWTLVSAPGKPRQATAPEWQLFDVAVDRMQQKNIAEGNPEVVRELSGAFERWWTDVQPQLVNEKIKGPKVNPFKELYWRQFGGGPVLPD